VIKKQKKYIYLFLAALFIRLIWILVVFNHLGADGFIEADTKSYIRPAIRLLAGEGFSQSSGEGLVIPELMRTPGYPLIIAFSMLIAKAGWLWFLLVLQAVLDSIVSLCIYLFLYNRVNQKSAALIGFLYYSFSFTSIFAIAAVLTESFFTAILFFGVVFLYNAYKINEKDRKKRSVITAILSGIFFGFATLIRPVGLYPLLILFILLITVQLIQKLKNIKIGKSYISWLKETSLYVTLITFFVFGIITGSWIVRNEIVADYPSISSIDYVNLMFYRAAPVEAYKRGLSSMEMNEIYKERYGLKSMNDQSMAGLQRGKELSKEAVSIILDNFRVYLRIAFGGALRLMFGAHQTYMSFFIGEGLSLVLSRLMNFGMVLIWIIALRGVITESELWPMAALTFFIIVISSGWEAYSRFRVPLEPYIAISFGIGLQNILGLIKKQIKKIRSV